MAIIAATARSVLQLRTRRRLFADDIFLLLACACLTAATVIFNVTSTNFFLGFDGWLLMPPDILKKKMLWFRKMIYIYTFLSWAVIYIVKFSFLCFFKLLIERLRGMLIYWKIVVGVTVVSFGFCVSEQVISCPSFNDSNCKFFFPFHNDEMINLTYLTQIYFNVQSGRD